MKVFGKKSLSTILYWVFLVCSLLYTFFLLANAYLFLFTDLSQKLNSNGPQLIFQVLPLDLQKVILFYLLTVIFKSFKSDVVFTSKTARHLKIFAVFCICFPFITATIQYFSINNKQAFLTVAAEKYDIMNFMVLNLIIGVFALYISAIF
ncbi:MAG: hypothetical protein ACON5F_02115 [Jejuia sp.]